MPKIWLICEFLVILNAVAVFANLYDNQPKLITEDGNLCITSAMDKNISLDLKGRGRFLVNNVDLLQMLPSILNGSDGDRIPQMNSMTMNRLVNRVNILFNDVRGPRRGIIRRLNRLENGTRSGRGSQPGMRNLRLRVLALETKMDSLMTKIVEDNCRSGPCSNGGTCVDMFDGFLCHCPPQYQGATCVHDVNECENYAGTDLGCQNGATCMNNYGSYYCLCAPGFQGVHCTKRDSTCLTAPAGELCDHGVCVQTGDPVGFRCICDQGWTTNNVTVVCSTDVNECNSLIPHCSRDPPVQCINTPGSYTCGPCPVGYSGSGHYCVDIDECLINNGGCSVNPYVPCINTRGSFTCGSCPLGYSGDGRSCTQSGSGSVCQNVPPGICHPDATCEDVDQSIYCRCKPGFSGTGFGPHGCVRDTASGCNFHPCLNGGTCVGNGTAYRCICPTGRVGPRCEDTVPDPCSLRPCLHGGTCLPATNQRGFTCNCTASYMGALCQTERRSCGGTLTAERGTLKYPEDGSLTYNHNSRCAWLIRVNSTKVLNVTFTKFKLENSVECRYDWLQIHDGRSSAYHMIGRFCGTGIQPGHTIISTHNYLYLWFRSDSSNNHDGFELTWEAVDPRCGGLISTESYGTITSPGSPGNYPPNRDCQWLVVAPAGKRLQFHFFVMKIESHETCQYDYLAVYNGPSVDSPMLEKFCNTSHPPPLTSPGNEVTLFFHSDEDSTDAGFQIHYSVIEGFPGCGGIFTSFSGEFGSPMEDQQYPHNVVCEYSIKYPKGSKIRITFKSFNIEGGVGCAFDSLELYEIRADGNREFVKRYCGNELPKPYKSDGNELLFIFSTDWSASFDGFRIGYQIECGGTFEEETGVLTSPMYPNTYHDSRVCDYVIQAPIGKGIVLQFLDFDLEENSYPDCYYDYLEIFDGAPQTNSSKIGRYCWNIAPPTIVSTFNSLYLTMETDNSIGGRGFKANYTFVDVSCGGVVTTTGTVIKSPEAESSTSYAASSNCRWMIVAPAGHNVQITWLSFGIELEDTCMYDYVEVFDNSTHPARSVGKYCGSRTPPMVTSVGTMMTVVFVSDDTVNDGSFSFMVTFMDVSKTCGGHFYTSFGYIRSPGWPEPYMNDKQCEWVITVENGAQIELNVKSFELEEHHECEFDYLEVRNGGRSDSPLLGKFCGNKIIPNIRSFSNQLFVKFVTDSSRQEIGFDIEWDGTITGCGGTLTSPRGSIVSPNYPAPYADNAQCMWKISVSHGSVVEITFSDLDLEKSQDCTYDYLEVFDGRDSGSLSLGRFCSAEDHPLHLQTTGNFAMIRMRTDYSAQGRGFSLRYNTICNREVSNLGGIIESPNFPNNYPHSLNCAWKIQAPLGNRVYIEFLHFEVENGELTEGEDHVCNYDYVQIEEKTTDDVIKKKKYCNHAPNPFVSSGESVEVGFITDSSIAHTGFRLEYHIEGCGGVLTNPTGTISSPNYPALYPHHVHCYWTIKAPYGHSIELTITDFQMEVADKCTYDGLRISNSANNTITTLCHVQTKPTTYSSNGARMFLFFYTDVSLSGKGFNSTYKFIPQKCGGTLSKDGNLYSPNYPKNYDKNSQCEWLLQTDETHVLEIYWLDFDLETSDKCVHDSVKIYAGSIAQEDKLVMTWCGSDVPNITRLRLSTNEALVTFRSDDSIEAKGFHLNFTSACGSRIVTNSSGQLVKESGMYDRLANCTWTIIADDPAAKIALTVIQMDFFTFEYENRSQSILELFDGDSANATLLGSYNNAPPTQYSSGNSITLRMHSEENQDIIISSFTAHYSIFENACGGILKSEKGEFASPKYPNSYPTNVECIWILEASPGNQMFVEFSEFALADSEGCSEEYLEIRETNGGGKLLGVFCGSNQPTNLTAAEKVWIKFRSGRDVINEVRKFYASFSYLTAVEITNKDEGLITSPMYPLMVHGQLDYTWRITVDFGSVISVSTADVSILGDCYVYVQMYDGFNEEAPTLGEKICGVTPQESVTSTSNVVFIHANLFYPGFMGRRFKLAWKKVPRVPTKSPEESAKVCGVENIVLDRNHTNTNISSPGYPFGYDYNLNCTWIISSDDKAYHPVFVVNYLDLEDTEGCFSDRLILSQSRDMITWNKLAQICNIDYRNQQSYSGNPYLKVEFLTDWGNNRTGFRGLLIEDCGGYMTDPTGRIFAGVPTMPDRFTRFTTSCVWEIHVRQGRTIKFEFQNFTFPRTRETTACEGYILFKNGGSEDSPLLGEGKYCGDVKPVIPETISNRAYVKFDFGGNFRSRFTMTYREVSLACGGTIHLTDYINSTVITSPNYPNIPHPHTECIWILFAPNGESMSIDFEERFDLTRSPGCDKEYVEVRDGGTKNSELIGNFCNTMPPTLTSQSNILRVKYFTDVSDPKNGFKAKISVATCSGTLRQNEGVVSSPKYPGKGAYSPNTVCTYRIIGAPLTHFNITFVDIDLPESGDNGTCLSDRVSIYALIPGDSGEDMQRQLRGTFCGSKIPDSFFVDSHEALVEFTTLEHQDLYSGFSLRFNAGKETCGAEINAESGIITSPGYPTGRQNRRFCEWSITVPKGRRVKAELLDLDLIPASHTYSQRIGFYHDHRYLSRIRFIKGEDPLQTIYSSGNKMLVNMWVRIPSSHRGFKLRFSSDEPTVCQGDLNNAEGDIESPKNLTTFYCEYVRDAGFYFPEEPNVGTLAFRFQDAFIGRSIACRLASTRISVSWLSREPESPFLKYLCGNISDTTVRSPFPDTKLEVRQGLYYGPITFKLHHKVHKCGGVVSRASEITQPTFAANYGRVDCAWHIRQSDGFAIQLQILQVNLTKSCDEEYIDIYNGGTQLSPHLMKICGVPTELSPVMSENNFLFMEYHSQEYSPSSKFKFHVVPAVSGCGGIIHKWTQVITSPGNSSYYPNNIECIWEFRPDPGFHVGLEFVDRFYIEDSVNCTKDYIEIFDFRSGEWHSMGRVCGRETPPIFNATESSMKLVFRTDGAITGDGFSVKWYQNCGGLYEVQETTPEVIFSPNYPSNYARLLNCNYTFVAPSDQYILLKFDDFELEESVGRCIFDNVTIYKANEWSVHEPPLEVGVYCRKDSPGTERYKSKVSVVFRTDKWVERKGFRFYYSLDSCGGAISNSTLVTSPGFENMVYPNDLNCVWNITAPVSKTIVIKFEKLDIEGMDTCYGDFVSVFRGPEMKDDARLAKLCGNITHPPAIKVDFASAILHFKSDLYNNNGGFSAAVIFTTSCDRRITLTETTRNYYISTSEADYQNLQDCNYYIKAPVDSNIQLKFTRFHIAPCDNNSTTTDCSCDFVEVRDGQGPFSELVGKFCGHTLPPTILTSRSSAYIRFVTDSRTASRGFYVEITSIPNPCGDRLVNVTDGTSKYLYSPGQSKYPPNVKCSWIVENKLYEQVHLIFEKFDLQGPDLEGKCSRDHLEIADEAVLEHKDVSFGEDLVYNGVVGGKFGFYMGTRHPLTHHHYCGNGTPADYVSQTHRVHVTFQTDSDQEGAGFRILVSPMKGCHRNYTETQGRIYVSQSRDCDHFITVPENYTIAIYFVSFSFYNMDCNRNGIKVYEGDNENFIGSFCGYTLPDPIFSTTNKLHLAVRGSLVDSSYTLGGTYDITFLATDQGRGCGGVLFNYGGTFTSPLYPMNDRNNSHCTWDVNVPSNLRVALRFSTFDLGTKLTCQNNYVDFLEVEADGKTRIERHYCGDDTPAVYKSEKSRVLVQFVKDVNFAGSGWILQFMGVHEDAEIYNW